jgi:hypothetical protein
MHKTTPYYCRLLALMLIAISLPAYAEIYKWVDAAGRVHFSDEAPDGAQTKTLNPDTARTGVQLSAPDDAQAWSDKALTPEPAAKRPKPAKPHAAAVNYSETDLCEGIVGDCFTQQQDYVCKLRFGLPCAYLYHWKVCLQQDCQSKNIADKCESPYQLLDRRPAVLTQRDIGRPMPLQELVSARDWECLLQHGFFCDEVAFENTCQERYLMSCDDIKNWVARARMQCKTQRIGDCDDVDSWRRFRPVSVAERKKIGTYLRSGDLAVQDFLLMSLGVKKDDPSQYGLLQKALESLTGLNIRDRRRRFHCGHTWKIYR